MAATTYDYSISTDTHNGKVDPDLLTQEVEQSSITVTLDHINTDGDDLMLTFVDALSGGDKTTLDTVVADHTAEWPETALPYWEQDPMVTDPLSGVTGPFHVMQTMINRRELFNDDESPLYVPDHQPILGTGGVLEEHGSKIGNLDTIHSKGGWHEQQVTKALYRGPRDLLIYYAYLNSFNYGKNAWNNEKVAQDMARYDVLVFGDGIQDPSHPDYANTQIIIPRIKALNPAALIFGYVTTDQDLSTFETKADQWDTLQVHGIFMDESGYDYGRTRSEFNDRVNYVHTLTYAKLAFANAWNTDNILGTADDPTYPNTTYNPGLVESALNNSDWILLESLGANTTAYSTNGGYESATQWSARVSKMLGLRATYGVNFAGCAVIDDGSSVGDALSNFSWASALMASLESFGTSDTSYASSSATVKRWLKPDAAFMSLWSLNASVQVDVGDSDVYLRYVDGSVLKLDFSTGAQKVAVQRPPGAVSERSGVVSLSSESSKAVTFDAPFPVGCDVVVATPAYNVNVWVTGLSETGFTINLSTSLTVDVYWVAKGH